MLKIIPYGKNLRLLNALIPRHCQFEQMRAGIVGVFN